MKRVAVRLLGVMFAALAVSGCGKASSVADAGTTWKSIDAANAVPASDPRAEGQFRFLYDAWGTEQMGDWPPAEFLIALQTNEPSVFGDQFSKFGWIPDPTDTLPIGLKRGLVDASLVNVTCASCHVGKLPDGRLWLGQPNSALDLEGFRVAVNDRWVAAGHASSINQLNRQKKLQVGPGRCDAATSSYPTAVPARFPAYLQLGARTRLNYLGTGRNLRTETYLSIFSSGAGDVTTSQKLPFPPQDHVNAFLDFFGSLTPPSNPGVADVSRGRAVFAEAKCDRCHHPDDVSKDGVVTIPADSTTHEVAPGDDPSYPNGTIQTDRLHRVLISSTNSSSDGGVDNGYIKLLEFIQDNNLAAGPTDGYRVGYLGGLWARAPYLHNGSVPTLEELLKPAAERSKTFMLGTFTLDTTQPGNSNQGHEFGTTLSSADKTALVAYLNSL